jgi:hypothetical protein
LTADSWFRAANWRTQFAAETSRHEPDAA